VRKQRKARQQPDGQVDGWIPEWYVVFFMCFGQRRLHAACRPPTRNPRIRHL